MYAQVPFMFSTPSQEDGGIYFNSNLDKSYFNLKFVDLVVYLLSILLHLLHYDGYI